jgi:hypothetical protein
MTNPGQEKVCKQDAPSEPLAMEGETCEGFNENTAMPFPSCAADLKCIDSGLPSDGGSGSNVCVDMKRPRAQLGETCGGFDERTGKPFPFCAKGLVCEPSR